MDLQLAGKRALITGSTRGLGFATAKKLVEEGCQVAINGRTQESVSRAIESLHTRAGSLPAGLVGDVSIPEDGGRLVAEAAAALGGLDILITNAGGPPVGTFESFDDRALQDAVELSFLGHARLIRASLPHLKRSNAPAVLTVTSFTVKHPLDNLILSNSIRAATAALTKSLAIELGPLGIRLNSILPGWTQTERVDQILESRAQIHNSTTEAEYEKITTTIPLRRMAQPHEFAAVAAFLVSPAASYITGAFIPVDGGAIRGLL